MKDWISEQTLPIAVSEYQQWFAGEDAEFTEHFHRLNGHVMLQEQPWMPCAQITAAGSDAASWVLAALEESAILTSNDAKDQGKNKENSQGHWFLYPQLRSQLAGKEQVDKDLIHCLDTIFRLNPSSSNHSGSSSPSAYPEDWQLRIEQFNLPLPFPTKVQRFLFGPDFEQKGSHMQTVHLSPTLKNTSSDLKGYGKEWLALETQSQPINGMLRGKFTVKQFYLITQVPALSKPSAAATADKTASVDGQSCLVRCWTRLAVEGMHITLRKTIETLAQPFSKQLQTKLFHEMKVFAMKQRTETETTKTTSTACVEGASQDKLKEGMEQEEQELASLSQKMESISTELSTELPVT